MNAARIAIIADSGTDTDPKLIAAHDVRIVPLRIIYSDGSTYESGIDISPDEVVERFAEEIPSTSLPSPSRIQEAVDQALADGYEKILFISISSGLSATNQTMHMVADSCEVPCEVVDTKSIGMVAGMHVARAIELIEAGVPFEELKDRLEALAEKSEIFFGVKSLEYLYKGGRINGHIYRIGSILNVKPILTCDANGKYDMVKKARGWEKTLDKMVELTADVANKFEKIHLSICCSKATSDLFPRLEKQLREAISADIVSVLLTDISADLLVHTGPDLVGMGVQPA